MLAYLWALAAVPMTWVLVDRIRVWAERAGRLDHPVGRSAHTRPVPRLGGVAIVLVMAGRASLVVYAGAAPAHLLPAVAISLAIAAVGLADDLWNLPATPRLLTHVAAALATVWAYGPIDALQLGGDTLSFGPLAAVLTVLWIVWFVNAFNFMDGIDGIAGVQGLVAGGVWLALSGGDPAVAWLGALLAATSLGFLAHNWAPAAVFMGDAGATALGYWLAVLPLIGLGGSWQATVGLFALWPFVFDPTFTLLMRVAAGDTLIAGHRKHLYQRLTLTGVAHPPVTLLFGTLAAIGAMAGVIGHARQLGLAFSLATIGGLAGALVLFVHLRETRTPATRGAFELSVSDARIREDGP